MGKFSNGLVDQVKKENELENRQKKLHKKYHVPDDVVIVEKDNTIKFFVRTTGNVVKLIAGVVIFVLAVIGVAALIFPESRHELFHEAAVTLKELKGFLGMS